MPSLFIHAELNTSIRSIQSDQIPSHAISSSSTHLLLNILLESSLPVCLSFHFTTVNYNLVSISQLKLYEQCPSQWPHPPVHAAAGGYRVRDWNWSLVWGNNNNYCQVWSWPNQRGQSIITFYWTSACEIIDLKYYTRERQYYHNCFNNYCQVMNVHGVAYSDRTRWIIYLCMKHHVSDRSTILSWMKWQMTMW